jgi:tetratricopeptide (TPR) repeat protein
MARHLVAQGQKSEAAEWFSLAGRALEDQPRKTGGDLYNLACVQALAAAAISARQGGLAAEDRQERDQLIAAAMDALRRSIEVGSQTAAHMRADEDLAILNGRADFQALVARKQAAEEAAALAAQGGSGTSHEKLKAEQEALAARARLVKEDPRSRRLRADMAASQHAVGQVLTDLGRLDEAEKALKEALAARDALVAEEPGNARHRLDAGWTHLALGALHWKAVRLDRADREWTAALREMEAALRDRPDDAPEWSEVDNARIDVADRYLELGLWEEAGELLERVFRRRPASLARDGGLSWHVHAMLRLLAGDPSGYRASCAEFFRQFAHVETKVHLLATTLAGPEPLKREDLESVIAAARKDVERAPRHNVTILSLGMNLARAGRWEEALGVLDRSRPEYPESVPLGGMRTIVLHHLGRTDEARASLAEADRDVEQGYRKALAAPGPTLIPAAAELVLREVIRREAHALIDGKPAADDVDRRLVRARALAMLGRDADADKELAAARAARPDDPLVVAATARILAQRGPSSQGQQARALELLGKALSARPDDVAFLRTRAELFVQRGEWDKAAADLARLFKAPGASPPRWLVAGTWVVGPYPFDPSKLDAELARSLPPESDPDPSRPVAGPDGKAALAWRAATPADGSIDLSALVHPTDHVSAYVLTRVYAAEDRDIVALITNDDWLRLWCNGERVLDQPLWLEPPVPVPVHLRAGWNTLLAKVSNWDQGFSLRLKMTVETSEVARAFGAYLDKQGWNDRTKSLLDRLLAIYPEHPFYWQDRMYLDNEVVRRPEFFRDVVAARPKDARLWLARGQWLAWLGRWDEALAAYDRYLATMSSPQDAHFEYAGIVMMSRGVAAYRSHVSELAGRFEPPRWPYGGYVLARAGSMAPGVVDDPARLVRWAEPLVADHPKAGWPRHTLGLAYLRAGQYERAIREFERSAKDDPNWHGGRPALNELGLSLAHHHLGHAAEARRYFDSARDWLDRKESESADKATHPMPPMVTPDWIEATILRREAESLLGNRRLGGVELVDRTVRAGEALRLPLGVVELRHDPPRNSPPGSFRLEAPFRTKSPVADGRIEPDEYGPPLAIDFTDDKNPGRDVAYAPNPAKSPDDLSAELYLAYTRDDLFVAVKVRDDALIDKPDVSAAAFNDAVELFIDGDRLGGDLKPNEMAGSREGFQVGTGIHGKKYAVGIGTEDHDFVAKTSTFPGGYVVEFRIPLASIDVDDGAEVTPPGPGSTLRFNLAIVDNDAPVNGQQRYVVLWSEDRSKSPFFEGETSWPVDLHLARPVKYELVSGPSGAAIDPETGMLTWNSPKEPRTEKVTVRARDLEKPELTAEASFLITTTAPR